MGRGRKEETGSVRYYKRAPQRAWRAIKNSLEQVKAVDEFSSAGDREPILSVLYRKKLPFSSFSFTIKKWN